MKIAIRSSLIFLSLIAGSSTEAFVTSKNGAKSSPATSDLEMSSMAIAAPAPSIPFFAYYAPTAEEEESLHCMLALHYMVAEAIPVASPERSAVMAKGGNQHQNGVFAPMVSFMKLLLGDSRLNTVRGKVISMHTGVITNFVEKSTETVFGDAALRALFRMADKNGDGLMHGEELHVALQSLGFTWLEEKQIKGILKRAGGDNAIDMDAWVQEAPRTLRTNLIKLAKSNGAKLGFLAWTKPWWNHDGGTTFVNSLG